MTSTGNGGTGSTEGTPGRRSAIEELKHLRQHQSPTPLSKIIMKESKITCVSQYQNDLENVCRADEQLLNYVMFKHKIHSYHQQELLKKMFICGDNHDLSYRYQDLWNIGLNIECGNFKKI